MLPFFFKIYFNLFKSTICMPIHLFVYYNAYLDTIYLPLTPKAYLVKTKIHCANSQKCNKINLNLWYENHSLVYSLR